MLNDTSVETTTSAIYFEHKEKLIIYHTHRGVLYFQTGCQQMNSKLTE